MSVSAEEKAQAVGGVIGVIFGCIVGYLLALWLFSINPTHEYGWFMGIFQGGCWVFAWIHSWFNPEVFIKAPLHTWGYSFWYWVSAIIVSFSWIIMLLGFITNIRKIFS